MKRLFVLCLSISLAGFLAADSRAAGTGFVFGNTVITVVGEGVVTSTAALVLSTGAIKAQVDAVAVSTGATQASLNAVILSTGTLVPYTGTNRPFNAGQYAILTSSVVSASKYETNGKTGVQTIAVGDIIQYRVETK